MSKSGGRTPPPQPVETRRGGPARPVSDLLPQIGGASFKRFGFVQSAIVMRWAEIVGARYAAVSLPESIRFPHGKRADGTLHLAVRGAHGVMMQHITPEIIERVNRFFGYAAIARIVIRQGDVGEAPRTPRVAPSNMRPVAADIGDSLREIVDPEFKAVLAALAAGVSSTDGPPRVDHFGDEGE